MQIRDSESTEHLIAHYRSLLIHYGPTYQAVQWSSEDAQRRRFQVLSDLLTPHAAVIDVGCGLGDLLGFLREQRGFQGRYLGLDFVPDFVEHCQKIHGHDKHAQFRVFDMDVDAFPRHYDFLVLSGSFNNLIMPAREQLDWVRRTIKRMYASAEVAIAFNALSTFVGRHEPDLFYSHPCDMAHWCAENVSPRFTLRHDYNAPPGLGVPVDYTLYLFKPHQTKLPLP